MPQAVVFIVNSLAVSGAISVGTAVAIGTFAMTYGSYALLVGGLAYSHMKAKQAKRNAIAQYNAAQVDRLANVSSTTAPRELVLGRVRKAGAVFYKASSGADKRDMYLAIALAGHEIDAVEAIYLDDVLVQLDAQGRVTTAPYGATVTRTANTGIGGPYHPNLVPGSIKPLWSGGENEWDIGTRIGDTYQYTDIESTVQITTYLGAPGQAADPTLLANFSADWGAANTVQGCAYLIAKLTYNETTFPNGAPSITAVIRGAKIYDPRTGLTAWNENPALMMRHVYQHPKFGKATITAAEDARFIAAANACDTATTYTVGGVAQPSRALYKASLVVPFGTAAREALDDLAQAMGGSWAFAGGEIHLKAGVYTAPVMTLTDADLAVVQRNGDSEEQVAIKIGVHRERAQKYNTVKVKIWDQEQGYKQTDLTPLVGSALLARDGAELAQEVTMPAVGYAPQALHIAGVMMRDARDPLVVDLPFKLSAYPLDLFDTVELTLSRYGWSAKQFMILSRTWAPDGSIQLTLKETSASITQMDAGFSAQGFAANTNLPKPWEVSKVGALAVSSGTSELILQNDGTIVSRMRITWAQHPDMAVRQNGQIEVQYRPSAENAEWASEVVPGNETQVIVAPVEDGAYYIIRARAKTTLAVSDWNLQVQHRVLGKNEPPPNISNLSISGAVLNWTPAAALDLRGYVFRFHYGTNRDWGTAAPLHEGVLTSSPFELTARPGGVVTIMGKALDTSGNESVAAALVVLNLGDPLIANVVEEFDLAAGGFVGMVEGGEVIGGELVAEEVDSAYGTDNQSFYGADNAPAFDLSSYAQMRYTTAEIAVHSALAGSVMTIEHETQGTDLIIEYRLAGPASVYGADSDSTYGEDSEPFYGPPGPWLAWPGQIIAANDVYQFRVTLGAGTVQGRISELRIVIDAPDIVEYIEDVPVSAAGTVVPYTKAFTVIKTVTPTLQANASGAETVEVDKTNNLAPVLRAYNASHTAVSGATVDVIVKGY